MPRALAAVLALALALGAAISGPAAAQNRPGDPATCEALYREYDAAIRSYGGFYRNRGENLVVKAVFSRLSIRLRTNGCLTGTYQIPELDPLRQQILSAPRNLGGARIEPISVSIGTVTSTFDDFRVLAFFRALGYPARSLGQEEIGRRIFVGPVVTEGSLAEVIDIARRAGFVSPYPTNVYRF